MEIKALKGVEKCYLIFLKNKNVFSAKMACIATSFWTKPSPEGTEWVTVNILKARRETAWEIQAAVGDGAKISDKWAPSSPRPHLKHYIRNM